MVSKWASTDCDVCRCLAGFKDVGNDVDVVLEFTKWATENTIFVNVSPELKE